VTVKDEDRMIDEIIAWPDWSKAAAPLKAVLPKLYSFQYNTLDYQDYLNT
jgi:hypothetical protein